jgi:hypothetical protein
MLPELTGQKTPDIMWEFVERIPDKRHTAENTAASAGLAARLRSLSLPNEPYAPFGAQLSQINETRWSVIREVLFLGDYMRVFMSGSKLPEGITQFGFRFTEDTCELTTICEGKKCAVGRHDGADAAI